MTKKIFILIISIISVNIIFAQLNEGGQPLSKNLLLSKNIPSKQLPEVSTEWQLNAAAEDGKNGTIERVAKNIKTNYSPKNSGLWENLYNGNKVWRLKIKADNAKGINPLFKNFHLAQGAKLYVYSPDYKQILGAYTEKNNHQSGDFSTEVISGSEMILELIEPADQIGQSNFIIDQVGSFFKDVAINSDGNHQFGASDPCQVNINCSPVGNNWQDEKRGVARILVVNFNGQGWCTGSLVNNGNYDCKNYFLTALHCGNNPTVNFNQWIFYFNFESAGCANGNQNAINSGSVSGATVRAESRALNSGITNSSDFLLLELNSALPASFNPYYNGWNISANSSTGGVGIHHPSGDIKKISTYSASPTTVGVSWNNNGTYGIFGGGPTHWQVVWTANANGRGVTEGGSSGSPLFNNNSEIIGTLTGGGSTCNVPTNPDQYGKMSYHWQSNGNTNNNRLSSWLDPNNVGLTSIQGSYAPCAPLSPNDAGISAILNPTGTLCTASISPEVTLMNFGSANLTSCTINYSINNGVVNTFNWTGNLVQNSNVNIVLPAINAPVGANTLEVYTSNPNGALDNNSNNNSSTGNFTINSSSTLPLVEDFEGNSFPPANFLIGNIDNSFTWEHDLNNGFGNGSRSMFINNWNYNAPNQFDWFVTETFDFSNVINATLSYDIAYAYYQQTNGNNVGYDTLGIAVSTDCGNSFYWLWRQGGVQLATAGGLGVEFFPSNSDWSNNSLDLSSLDNEGSVQFAFIAINGFGNNMFIDNININNTVALNPPDADFTANTSSICIGNTVNFTDISTNSPTSLNWTFTGGTPSSSTLASPSITYNTPGTYQVSLQATNADGSDTEVKTGFITVNDNANISFTTTEVSCFGGNNGSINAVATGNAPYTYLWAGNNSTSSSLNNQIAGNYTVIVTDVNGCMSSNTGIITEPAAITLNSSVSNAFCNNSNGSIQPQASGGTAPFTYSYSNGGNGSNLAPGTYTITVQDANNCSYNENIDIPNINESFSVTISTSTTSCTANTGTASASINGQTNGYTFAWDNGQTSASATNLSFGNHTVVVTNANGCSEATSFFINSANAPQVILDKEDLSCFGDNDGSASINISGGSPAYSILWSSSNNNGNVENNLSAGDYTVTVSDALNCISQLNFSIIEPPAIVLSIMSQDEHCNSSDGQLLVSATGGTPNYTYEWNDGSTSTILSNQPAGSYTVIVTDANECEVQTTQIINHIEGASFDNININNNSCAHDENGSISLDVVGGTGNLIINWSNGATTPNISSLSSGDYTLTVVDNANCLSDTTLSIVEPDPIQIALDIVDQSPSSTSSISVNAIGGSPALEYLWSTGSSEQSINNLSIGTYTLTITDSENCKRDTTINIGSVGIFESEIIQNISIFPNPVAQILNIKIELEESLGIKLNVLNAIGQKLISRKIKANTKFNQKIDMSLFSKGVYFLEIESSKGKSIRKFIKMN